MTGERINAFVELNRMRDPLGSGIFLHLVQRPDPRGPLMRPAYCSAIQFTRCPENNVAEPLDLTAPNLTAEAAQELMESLWNAGIRPSQAAGSVGQLGAVEAHLRDMRHLAFKGHPPT
jgi:hypothetical protein